LDHLQELIALVRGELQGLSESPTPQELAKTSGASDEDRMASAQETPDDEPCDKGAEEGNVPDAGSGDSSRSPPKQCSTFYGDHFDRRAGKTGCTIVPQSIHGRSKSLEGYQ